MISNRAFNTVILLCLVTYLLGMFFIPLMDIDASQYASISREMLENKSYLQLYDLGRDYLDKPPMLFWLSAASMKLFGVHDWAYRLPSFFFAVLALYSTYRLALIFYRKDIAQLSAMVLAACQAMFLITHDVRCDTMLMGWVALSLWQLAEWYRSDKWKYLTGGFVAIAGGMLTKGPIALMVPAFAFVPHFLLRREWKQFFRWEYLMGLVIIAILLVPMSIGLYRQFDLHPGKLVNGVPIRSGLRFYYWTQSFGRYTGENYFHEMNDFFFLMQNMLWSFLPWIVLFMGGLVYACRDIILKKFRISAGDEFISTGGFILTYCILARSQAQLPHYIFVVYPLAAIVTARFIYVLLYTDVLARWKKPLLWFHAVVFTLLWAAAAFLMAWPFGMHLTAFVLALACMAFFFFLLLAKRQAYPALLTVSFFTVIGVNIFLGTVFYPNVLRYQMGNEAAGFMEKEGIDAGHVSLYHVNAGRSLDFYGKHIFPEKDSLSQFKAGEYMITPKDSLISVAGRFPGTAVVHEGPHFGVSILTLPFLNPKTRDQEVSKYVLLRLSANR